MRLTAADKIYWKSSFVIFTEKKKKIIKQKVRDTQKMYTNDNRHPDRGIFH